jgi:hypothetical protein
MSTTHIMLFVSIAMHTLHKYNNVCRLNFLSRHDWLLNRANDTDSTIVLRTQPADADDDEWNMAVVRYKAVPRYTKCHSPEWRSYRDGAKVLDVVPRAATNAMAEPKQWTYDS